jgi:1-deoxy-D-xylulose 5-phosphate reductoisomerase
MPGQRGQPAAILNAANEEVVEAFLDHRIPYLAIAETLEKVLIACGRPAGSLEELEASMAKPAHWPNKSVTRRPGPSELILYD